MQNQQQNQNNMQNQQQNQSDWGVTNRSKGSWGSGLGSSWQSFNRNTHDEAQEGWPKQETFEENAQRLYGGKSNSGSYKNNDESLKQSDSFE